MTLPQHVTAPRDLWKLTPPPGSGRPMGQILHSANNSDQDSLAAGYWDGDAVLASRWDTRGIGKPKGNPISSGHPTWFILPNWMYTAVLNAAVTKGKIDQETCDFAIGFVRKATDRF